MSLTIEVEDIYFITGLSQRGEVVNLRSRGGPGGGLTIDEYIAVLLSRHREGGESGPYQCYIGARPKGHTIDIGQDSRLGILHQASRPLIFYAMECMRPTIYDWSTTLLSNMKHQLSECKAGRV